METPIKEAKGARTGNKIVSILNSTKKDEAENQVSFSFRADNSEAIKSYIANVDK
jgi:hypothetical protein